MTAWAPSTIVQSMFGRAQLPEQLATICDGMTVNGTVCQGFNYNSELKRAIFKGQAPNLPLVMNHFTACNWQKYSFWALNAGEMLPQNCHPVAILQAVCRVSC